MLVSDIEKLAAKGEPLPKELIPPEIMLYYMLSGLYTRYQSGKLTTEQGKEQKRQILNTYRRVKEDYEQYVGICKEYQRRIREETIMHYAK